MRDFVSSSPAPLDQAHGLRQLFAASRQCFVPLVHNPHVAFGGVAMERLCTAFAERGLHTLVVDAADTASPPQELAQVDLSACIEALSAEVSYLAARGLPMRHLDSRGRTTGFLAALVAAAPRAEVMLVHAGAADIARLFAGRTPRPILLAAESPDSLTHAYGSMKLLAQRLGVLAYDLVIAGSGQPRRIHRIADRLADCGDRFLGAVLSDWALVDPSREADEVLPPALRRLAEAQLQNADTSLEPLPVPPRPPRPGATRPAAAAFAN